MSIRILVYMCGPRGSWGRNLKIISCNRRKKKNKESVFKFVCTCSVCEGGRDGVRRETLTFIVPIFLFNMYICLPSLWSLCAFFFQPNSIQLMGCLITKCTILTISNFFFQTHKTYHQPSKTMNKLRWPQALIFNEEVRGLSLNVDVLILFCMSVNNYILLYILLYDIWYYYRKTQKRINTTT